MIIDWNNRNYDDVFAKRIKVIQKIKHDKNLIEPLKAFYKLNPVAFIEDWCVTYDPRNKPPIPKVMPFVLFPRQKDFIDYLYELWITNESGLCEKARDMGASWLCVAFSVWLWLFHEGSAIGWGSRKAEYIDERGDPKAVFPKIRQVISYLPGFLRPLGFDPVKHATYMKIINPENGATITGESGDGIGRGGRTTIYFKDEALTLTSKILTISGWKLMGDLTMKDKVIDVKGKPQNITNINDAGIFQIYKVIFSDGTFVECSPNHFWTLNKVHGKRESVTLRTKELYESYKYISKQGQVQYKYRLPLISPIEFEKKELPLHPYVIGALIGDGGLSQVPKCSPNITSIDTEILEHFEKCLPDYCVMKKSDKMTYRLGDVQGRMGWKHKSRIRQAILETGLAGKKSWEKSIPDIYKYSSISDRIELLQGLMDTDGSAGKSGGSCAYYTSSQQLALDIRFLAESLGGYATMKIKKDKRGFRDQYVCFLILPSQIEPFRLKRKLEIFNKRKNSIERSVISVEKTERIEPVRCISVDSNDRLYLTNGCIPTHNSAHYERPELIAASLDDNTNVQIDISSVNGSANVFYRKRMAGAIWEKGEPIAKSITRVFIFDWRDHPLKTQEWYDNRRSKSEKEGLLHKFAQEVDRDYSSSVDRLIIEPQWITAAIDAHVKLNFTASGEKIAGQDIADEGGDKNALVIRHGVILQYCEAWGGSAGDAALKSIPKCLELGVTNLQYDSIGVGSGFKNQTNNMIESGAIPKSLQITQWNAAASPINPDSRIISGDSNSPTNNDFYGNLKAQGWWNLRTRFYKTYQNIINGDNNPHEELISLPSNLPNLHQLKMELSQAVHKYSGSGKLIVDKKPQGSMSPNLADAMVICYTPAREVSIFDVL